MNNKWEEKTKLDRKNKIMIAFYIIMTIFNVAVSIIEKDTTWILCALLWINLAVKEYCDSKLLKGNEVIIDIQNEENKLQKEMNNILIEEIDRLSSGIIVDINKIKIPPKYKKPNQNKLKERTEYFKVYKQFAVPIIVDKNNNLIDGYTTYLIAKQNNFSHIEIWVKNK